MRIVVFGLWHLGCVTAGCLARAGHQVIGLDLDEPLIAELRQGRPPLFELGLAELIAAGLASDQLSFTTDAVAALANADLVWVAFDTPVSEQDEANVGFVRTRLDAVVGFLRPGTMVLISSQVPAGFTGQLQQDWADKGLQFAYSPENLRLGKAISAFCEQERIILGTAPGADRSLLTSLFAPFCSRLEFMSIASAEMTKHALNAFLATSVTFINEVARLCETVGADAKEVERGLKSEGRIGSRAYLSPGSAFAGGTLARDVRFLVAHGQAAQVDVPLFEGVLASNERHKGWLQEHARTALAELDLPVVGVLGLTYKPGTSTLRRSASVELCRWLHALGARVRAHDPAISSLPAELGEFIELADSPLAALDGAHLAIIATEWPDYRTLAAQDVTARMHQAVVLDPNHFLAGVLGRDPRIRYVATGKSAA